MSKRRKSRLTRKIEYYTRQMGRTALALISIAIILLVIIFIVYLVKILIEMF